MARKPRSDSALDSLPAHQREQLRTWLVDENLSYEKAVERIEQDFGVRTSRSAVQQFYALRCFSLRSSEAREFAEHTVRELKNSGESFDEATIALVRQKAFERAYAKDGNLDELAVLAKILGDSRKLSLKAQEVALTDRRIKLLEAKAAQADKAKAITGNPELSEAEKGAQLRLLFGMG